MGQYWLIIDIDGERIIGGGGKLGEFFWDSSGSGILNALRIPAHDPKLDQLTEGTAADQRASPLLNLAQELYDLILDEFESEDYLNLLSCAVTCKTALARSRKHIIALQEQQYASPIAGHRIICVGDYADHPRDLPPGMLTAQEVQELLDFASKSHVSPSLYAFASEHYDDVHPYNLAYPNMHRSSGRLTRWMSMPRGWDSSDWRLVMSIGLPYYPEDQPWALCNLTKREYVDKDAATRLCRSLPRGEGYYGRPEFWHFLLSSICCSPDSSISMPYEGEDLVAGRWAGDRIAMILLDSLPPAAEGEGPWTDVTDDIGALVKRVWEAEL